MNFDTRVPAFLEKLWSQKDEAIAAREIEMFAQQEAMADHSGYSEAAIRHLFVGRGTQKGLFDLAGDAYLLKRGTPKPHARAALMALFNILSNERTTTMTNVFRHMPVSDLQKLKLWKHLKRGDPNEQMAAFRLLRVLYHTYPQQQFMSIINGKQKTLDLFNTMHARWMREHPSGGALPATGHTDIPADIAAKLPPAPIVEQTIQPVVQPVQQEVRQTVVQPVLQRPDIVQVERAPIVNAPRTAAPMQRETVINAPVLDDAGVIPRDRLPARPVVEATVQPIVQPIVEEVRQTIVQPLVQQPEIVQVERAAIVNAPMKGQIMQKETIVNAPVTEDSGVVSRDLLPPRPVVEAVIQPVVQPVQQEIRQTVLQPVIMQPEMVQVTRQPIINAPTAGAVLQRETLVAEPIILQGSLERLNLGATTADTITAKRAPSEPTLAQKGPAQTGA